MTGSAVTSAGHFAAPSAPLSAHSLYAQQQRMMGGGHAANSAPRLDSLMMLPPSQARKAEIAQERKRAAMSRRQEQQDRQRQEASMEKAASDLFAKPEKVSEISTFCKWPSQLQFVFELYPRTLFMIVDMTSLQACEPVKIGRENKCATSVLRLLSLINP